VPQSKRKPEIRGEFAVVGKDCEIGEGARIWNMVYIGDGVKIGTGVTVSSLVHIADGVTIGDGTQIEGSAYIGRCAVIGRDCFIGPNTTLAEAPVPPAQGVDGAPGIASAVLEDGVIVGANAVIRSGVTVGRRSVVGMGAVVLQDVPPESVVVGSPARFVYPRSEYDKKQLEWVKASGGHPRDFTGLPRAAEPPA
jgi:acetyltransferase-like isoleucine patch superfamily enzyme